MIVHVYTIVRNEEMMMQYFLRHYSTFADRIFVIDDNSTDKTRELVVACPKATLLPFNFKNGLQEFDMSSAYTLMYQEHSRGWADWVICVDVDEFVYRPDILAVLNECKLRGMQVLGSTGYIMVSEQPPNNGGQIYDELKLGIRARGYDKPVAFDPAVTVCYGPGRHTLLAPVDTVRGTAGLKLLHYCYLSPEYIVNRITRNFSRMLDMDPLKRTNDMNYRIRRALDAYEVALTTRERVI